MAQLYVLSGADVGRSFDVKGGDTIGRSQDCILVFKDASISRRHAHLEEQEGRWAVIDDGSRNGIVVGGARTPRVELADGQEFLLGEVLLRFRAEAASKPPPAVREVAPPFDPAATRVAPAPTARPGPVAASPRPARSPASAESDEIVLEGADEIDLAARRPAAAPAGAPARAGLAEQRARVLQYHRVADTGSTLSVELGQLPGWKRWSLYLLALVLLAGITAAAFLGAAFVREKLAGAPGEVQEVPR